MRLPLQDLKVFGQRTRHRRHFSGHGLLNTIAPGALCAIEGIIGGTQQLRTERSLCVRLLDDFPAAAEGFGPRLPFVRLSSVCFASKELSWGEA